MERGDGIVEQERLTDEIVQMLDRSGVLLDESTRENNLAAELANCGDGASDGSTPMAHSLFSWLGRRRQVHANTREIRRMRQRAEKHYAEAMQIKEEADRLRVAADELYRRFKESELTDRDAPQSGSATRPS